MADMLFLLFGNAAFQKIVEIPRQSGQDVADISECQDAHHALSWRRAVVCSEG